MNFHASDNDDSRGIAIHSDQRVDASFPLHQDAVANRVDVDPGIGVKRHADEWPIDASTPPPPDATTGPTLTRDRDVLLLLVRLRFLAVSELHSAIFTGRHPSVITRALKRLRGAGWITTWDEPAPGGGGNRRWAVPTAKSRGWAAAVFRANSSGNAWERLAELMLPGSRNHEITLSRGKTPAFLMHQRDVNRLCLSFLATLGKRLLWFSAFDRPFPNRVSGIAMPQPDFVLVVSGDRGPELVLGEHDRGSESLSHFREAKIERYAELADLPAFCSDHLGFATFRVMVTVMDPVTRKPRERLSALEACASEVASKTSIRFLLAGRVHAAPMNAFSGDEPQQPLPARQALR